MRLAGDGDSALLAGLRAAWVEENSGGPVVDDGYAAAFDAWYEREREQRLTWLAFVDDACVGMLNLLVFARMPRPGMPDSCWGYLANFYVAAEHRGSGIGTTLLAACTGYADQAGFVRIVLSPSERSVPLYERSGFAAATSLMLRTRPD
ncbi:MAG: acetyltransferase [Marmoricola sp.]|nr:acetyltransferase [Marmoricola sp.]